MLGRGLAATLLSAVFAAAAAPALAQTAAPQPLPPQQQQQQPQAQPQPQVQANPVCARLEAQLASVERGGADQTRTEQIRKFEAAAGQQQAQLDRLNAQAKKAGCEGGSGFFAIFTSQPVACAPLNNQIQQMKGNLDRIQGELDRLQAADYWPERDGQRRALMGALAQNDCGPQYRQAAAQPQRSCRAAP